MHIVSPYLDVLSRPAALDVFTAIKGPPALREKCDQWAQDADITVVRDLSNGSLYATTSTTAAKLTMLKRYPRLVQPFREERPETWNRYLETGIIVDSEDAVKFHRYVGIEVEINRHCNYRCRFCPVAETPKPAGFIADDLFRLILKRAADYHHVREVSLNHYSEPTLNPRFIDYIRLCAEYGFRVRLHTNASLLDADKVAAIAKAGNCQLVVNLPSVNREDFVHQTGAKLFDRVVRNLELLHEHHIPTLLSINAPRETRDAQVVEINERFSSMFGESVSWPTDSRAGLVTDESYVRLVHSSGRLNGCQLAMMQLNVSHEGKAFLCCQDFDQEVVLGDLRQQSIQEVAESEQAQQVRRYLFGIQVPPEGFICSSCSWTEPAETSALLSVGTHDCSLPLDPQRLTAL